MLKRTDNALPPLNQATRKPWTRRQLRIFLHKRRKELRKNLAPGRVYGNRPLGQPEVWAFLIAEIAWFCVRDGGDLLSFRQTEPRVPPYLVISDAVARKALKRVGRLIKRHGENYRPTSAAAAAKMLGVTAQEVEELDLKTVRPAGCTLDAVERKKRDAERKRKRRAKASAKERQDEAKRQRERRARHRDGLSRVQYLAEAERKRAEIAASGKSRATHYRRRETSRVRETSTVRPPPLSGALSAADGRYLSHRMSNGVAGSGCNGLSSSHRDQPHSSQPHERASHLDASNSVRHGNGVRSAQRNARLAEGIGKVHRGRTPTPPYAAVHHLTAVGIG
jgi:hypothetical protein